MPIPSLCQPLPPKGVTVNISATIVNDNITLLPDLKYIFDKHKCQRSCKHGGCLGRTWLCKRTCYCYGVSKYNVILKQLFNNTLILQNNFPLHLWALTEGVILALIEDIAIKLNYFDKDNTYVWTVDYLGYIQFCFSHLLIQTPYL